MTKNSAFASIRKVIIYNTFLIVLVFKNTLSDRVLTSYAYLILKHSTVKS